MSKINGSRLFKIEEMKTLYALGVKRCSICGEIRPLPDFGIQRVSWDYHSSRCRNCHARKELERRGSDSFIVEYKKFIKDLREIYQQSLCSSGCGEVKPLSEFGVNLCFCKECAIRYNNIYRKQNPDKIIQFRREYYDKNKNEIKEWRQNNKKYTAQVHRNWYERNKEKKLQQNKEWYKKNPSYMYKKSARRRMAVELGDIDVSKMRERDLICYLCGILLDYTVKFPNPMAPVLEHKIPLSKGGSHTEDNVAYAHNICNGKKFTKTPEEMGL